MCRFSRGTAVEGKPQLLGELRAARVLRHQLCGALQHLSGGGEIAGVQARCRGVECLLAFARSRFARRLRLAQTLGQVRDLGRRLIDVADL